MTENKAIKIIRHEIGWESKSSTISAFEEAIKALEEIQQYRAIEKELKERYHANVDIPLLMQHFIETIFKGEKHEGFRILTNEDREAWEEYKSIGTPEECRTAVEKQKPQKAALVTRGNGFIKFYPCPHCSNPQKYIPVYPNQNYCVNCGQKLDWRGEE